jgi:TPR repeat protein
MRRILLALAIGLTVIALPGVTFAVSDEETVRLLKRDADQGNPNAQGRLGYFYETGRGGLAKDDREAARLFNLAADQGNASARVNLGYFYEKGRGDVAQDEREAARLYKLAADQGNAGGQNYLGILTGTAAAASPRTSAKPRASSSWPPSRTTPMRNKI